MKLSLAVSRDLKGWLRIIIVLAFVARGREYRSEFHITGGCR